MNAGNALQHQGNACSPPMFRALLLRRQARRRLTVPCLGLELGLELGLGPDRALQPNGRAAVNAVERNLPPSA